MKLRPDPDHNFPSSVYIIMRRNQSCDQIARNTARIPAMARIPNANANVPSFLDAEGEILPRYIEANPANDAMNIKKTGMKVHHTVLETDMMTITTTVSTNPLHAAVFEPITLISQCII